MIREEGRWSESEKSDGRGRDGRGRVRWSSRRWRWRRWVGEGSSRSKSVKQVENKYIGPVINESVCDCQITQLSIHVFDKSFN